ncbi:MAG TPA: tRNA uridine-5-carboxymethylaminomethyl(34) synthesis GTPase MnmE [Terriglobales bacterium]|nr:tRNA uridine-5-carboxymethylaminomethyl(34) synthesis GTPase MnmE [Terriglobales bacterium]
MHLDDTIVAIATPPGRGGVGVVRVSGPEARAIARPMLRLAQGHELEAARAHFGELIDPATGERIDEVVATFFAKPHSYTTDDVVEISCHGSPVVLRHVVEMAISAGARLAEPGEFTMRAFLNGRIDLTQAEAVRDLIDSQTLYQAQVAARQLDGSLSKRLQPIKQKLLELIATMEAGVDFAEDDVAVIPDEQILVRIAAVRAPLEELLASFAYGKVVHEGLTLAIVGRPNVGKSSLFNRLVERERAIVTATPGTTRDLVTETVAIGGIPVRLVDTAGLRAAADEAESIGVRKSLEALADADLVLVLRDASRGEQRSLTEDELRHDERLLELVSGRQAIVVWNKVDLATDGNFGENEDHPTVAVSALTGKGVEGLRSTILQIVGGDGVQQEHGLLTNIRQKQLVSDALKALDKAAGALPQRIPHEMILLDLYSALRPLDEITGATTSDDILNLIFSSFCIGK